MVDGIADFAALATDPGMLATVFAAVAVFATILTVALPAFQGDKLETRLKAVTNRREQLRRQNRAALEGHSLKKGDAKGFIKSTVDKLDLAKALEDPNVKAKLIQAGLRGPGPLATFYFFRFALPIAFGALAFIYLFLVDPQALQPHLRLGALVFAAAAGFYLPNFYVGSLAEGVKSPS